MYENFTAAARSAIGHAYQEAYRHHSDYLGTEHLLLGLIEHGDNDAVATLHAAGVDPHAVRRRVEQTIGPVQSPRLAHLPLSPSATRALIRSAHRAWLLGQDTITTEHLLYGLIHEDGSAAADALLHLGVR